MNKRDIGQEILDGIKEIKTYKNGDVNLVTRTLTDPSPTKEIREKLNISQTEFSTLMGVSVRTIQDWEQGRRNPSGLAKALLRVAEQAPDIFLGLQVVQR